MKASELVLQLQALIKQCGDRDVTAHILDDDVRSITVLDQYGEECRASGLTASQFFLE